MRKKSPTAKIKDARKLNKPLGSRDAAVYQTLFPFEPSRAQQRTMQIIEGAIENYVSIGIENTTYDTIAKACKISRPLIQNYFEDKKAIFEMAVKYIRFNFQQMAIEGIQKQSTPELQLEGYVRSTFDWIRKYPVHTRVWSLFFYYCAVDPKVRHLNSDMVNMGHERITMLLCRGVEAKAFRCPNPSVQAKVIQTIITGALVCAVTENLPVSLDDYEKTIIAQCFAVVGIVKE